MCAHARVCVCFLNSHTSSWPPSSLTLRYRTALLVLRGLLLRGAEIIRIINLRALSFCEAPEKLRKFANFANLGTSF